MASDDRGWQRRLSVVLVISGTLTFAVSLASVLTGWSHLGQGFPAVARALFAATGMLILQAPADPPDTALFAVASLLSVFTASLGGFVAVSVVYGRGAELLRLKRMSALAARPEVGRRLVVVCGLGRVGAHVVQQLCAQKGPRRRSVIVVEANASNRRIAGCRAAGALVLIGSAADPALRKLARFDRAEKVFLTCGDDATNVDLAAAIAGDIAAGSLRRSTPLACFADVASPVLAGAMRADPRWKDGGIPFRFHPFDPVDSGARLLIETELAGDEHAPAAPDDRAWYVLLGFGAMGQAIAAQAAHLAHFENRKRLRMTIADDWDHDAEAARHRRAFLDRYPAFGPDGFDLGQHAGSTRADKDDWGVQPGRPAAVGWQTGATPAGDPTVEYVTNAEFLQTGSADAPGFIAALDRRLRAREEPAVRLRPCIIVCFDEDRRNLEAVLRLSDALAAHGHHLPYFVYLPHDPGLVSLVEGRSANLERVVAFGQLDQCASLAEIEQPGVGALARAFHATYPSKGAPGPDAFGESNKQAAHHGAIKLASIARIQRSTVGGSLSAEALTMLAEIEHNRWMSERLMAGWRYGTRDDVQKRRDTFRDWRFLPEAEKHKDVVQVRSLLDWAARQRGANPGA